jgi:hypothetical protein
MRSPVRQIKEAVEVFLHPRIRIALEIPERIFVHEARRGDACARGVSPQFPHFFFAEPAISRLKLVILIFAHWGKLAIRSLRQTHPPTTVWPDQRMNSHYIWTSRQH